MKRTYRAFFIIIGFIIIIVGILGLYRKIIRKDTFIMIDAGHGGEDPGTIGVTGVYEKELNLEVAKKLKRKLWLKGYKTEMVREDDITLNVYERSNIANNSNADIYISLHCNATENDPNMNGVQILYYPDMNGSNEEISRNMLNSIIKETGAVDRRVIPRKDLIVLNHTNMKSILVEMGFLTNELECRKLENSSYQNKLVKGIIKTLNEYY